MIGRLDQLHPVVDPEAVCFCFQVAFFIAEWLDKCIWLTDESAALIDLYKGFIWSWVYSDFCCKLFCQCIGVFDFFGFFIFNWGEAASASAHVFVLRFLCLFIIYSYVVYSHFF